MIDFDAEGNLIRKLTSTASETDAAAAANDLLERLHHKKTEPTASELEQLAREAADQIETDVSDVIIDKELLVKILSDFGQQVQELTRMSAAKPTTGEHELEPFDILKHPWTGSMLVHLYNKDNFFQNTANAHNAALADAGKGTLWLEWKQECDKLENQLVAEREQVESWQVRCDRRESQLSALQASIDSHNEDTGLNCYRIATDTTALDAAIAAERNRVTAEMLSHCAVKMQEVLAAAQKPLVDALTHLRRVDMTRIEMKAVIDAALANVKEGK